MHIPHFFNYLNILSHMASFLALRSRTDAIRRQAEIRIAAFEAIPAERQTFQDRILLGASMWLLDTASPCVSELEELASSLSPYAAGALALEHAHWGTKKFEELDAAARLHFGALLIEFELTGKRAGLFDEERKVLGLKSSPEKVVFRGTPRRRAQRAELCRSV